MESNEEEEAYHYKRVIEAFKTYADRSRRALRKHFEDLNRLEPEELALVPEYREKLNELAETVLDVNQAAFDQVIAAVGPEGALNGRSLPGNPWPTDRDFENLRSLLRQMVRDWSTEGEAERIACYTPILEALKTSFPDPRGKRVLVPGAGLGRLAYELVQLGFSAQGNEFSLYMLLPSQFILNHSRPGCLSICPFAQPLSNAQSRNAAHRVITVPDIQVQPPPHGSIDFSMTAGDFVEVYSRPEEQGAWDGIVSCYFLDTAPNVVRYLRMFWSLLKPGGRWINHGPLQYHFEGSHHEQSVELSWEEVKLVAERIGFKFVEERVGEQLERYAADKQSLTWTQYRPIHSVAVKPAD